MPLTALALAALAAAAEPAAAGSSSTEAQPATTQQQFDAAEDALAAGRWAEAAAGYELLESRPAISRSSHTLGVVRVHEGMALFRLGRAEEAGNALVGGLAGLDPAAALDRPDVLDAHRLLGQLAMRQFSYERAAAQFAEARALASGVDAFDLDLWLARATMFDPGPQAVHWAEEALSLGASLGAGAARSMPALHTLHARALLNHGQAQAAYAELQAALKAQGGLTERVSQQDIITRSDLAIAAMLNGKEEDAHRYLAYTGAGHFEKSPFAAAVDAQPPPCGGQAGLRPGDFAIIEFGIADDGTVQGVMPVYASRLGPVAVEFARAVAGWSWRPADAKAIPDFFRHLTRVQVACSTATQHPDVLAQLEPSVQQWLADHQLVPAAAPEGKAAELARARERLAQLGPVAGIERVPPLLVAADNPLVDPAERARWLAEARGLMAANGAPAAALAWADVKASDPYGNGLQGMRRHRELLRTLLARPEFAADARSASVLRMLVAEGHFGLPPPDDAESLLLQVASDPRLEQDDPLRAGAWVRLASLQAASGHLESARASYARSGVDEQQCSLVDARPPMKNSHAGSASFPMAALRWGFDGWVIVQSDVLADGSTTNRRALVAYPPLVFGSAAEQVLRDARYEQTYRPSGGAGCTGNLAKVNFSARPR